MVTPIQLVRMIAAVANGGDLVQPHLLKNFTAKTDHFPLADDTVEQVTRGMYGVDQRGRHRTPSLIKLAKCRILR